MIFLSLDSAPPSKKKKIPSLSFLLHGVCYLSRSDWSKHGSCEAFDLTGEKNKEKEKGLTLG